MPSQDTVKWSSLCLLLLSLCLALPVPSPADDGLLQQVDIGLLSIGGRAMYYDPKEGDANWYGGAQVRLHPWHYFAIEGSADYRRNDYAGGTSAHSYPVQVSALIYPLGTTQLAPTAISTEALASTRPPSLPSAAPRSLRPSVRSSGIA